MEARPDRVVPRSEHASCDAALFKQVVKVLQFQSLCFGEEEVDNGDLFMVS